MKPVPGRVGISSLPQAPFGDTSVSVCIMPGATAAGLPLCWCGAYVYFTLGTPGASPGCDSAVIRPSPSYAAVVLTPLRVAAGITPSPGSTAKPVVPSSDAEADGNVDNVLLGLLSQPRALARCVKVVGSDASAFETLLEEKLLNAVHPDLTIGELGEDDEVDALRYS